jgi:hypothetical protein
MAFPIAKAISLKFYRKRAPASGMSQSRRRLPNTAIAKLRAFLDGLR